MQKAKLFTFRPQVINMNEIKFPRVTTEERDLIRSPGDGLLYNTDTGELQQHRPGLGWINVTLEISVKPLRDPSITTPTGEDDGV